MLWMLYVFGTARVEFEGAGAAAACHYMAKLAKTAGAAAECVLTVAI